MISIILVAGNWVKLASSVEFNSCLSWGHPSMNLLQHCSCIVPKCQTLNCCKIVMKLRNVGQRFPMLPLFQDTPIPGTYHVRDFVEEADLNPVKKTYGFKGVGRKTQTLGVRKGDLLLPGAYEYTDSTQEVLMHQASYSFKNCPRPDIFTLGIRDKVALRLIYWSFLKVFIVFAF